MNNVLETFSSIATNNTFSNPNLISIGINFAIFVIILIGSLIFLVKTKNMGSGYKLLFIFYLLFWIPIFLGRDFRSKMNEGINGATGHSSETITLIILVGYGFVGIFARVFADVFCALFKYRKSFLYLAVIVQIITFIPIIIVQTHATNIIQVIGVGLSASCIGTVELLFKSQYGNQKAFLTVSMLSIPPLLANFITAPIQSIVSTFAKIENKTYLDPNILKYLWVVGLIVLVIGLVMLVFVKETKIEVESWNIKKTFANSNYFLYFLILAFLGSIVAFIKFSNSGAIGLNHLKVLDNYVEYKNAEIYQGYLSVVFSLAQLFGGVLMGMVIAKKWDSIYTFLLGSMTWIFYLILTIIIKNPYAYFGVHALNGFGYGILYNLLLALVLSVSYSKTAITPMGLYQSILSIGIAASSGFTGWLKEVLPVIKNEGKDFNYNLYFKNNEIVNGVLIGCCLLMIVVFSSFYLYNKLNSGKNEVCNKFYKQQLMAKNKIIIE